MRIKCDDLEFRYPGSEEPVFSNLSFTMDSPGFNAVFGPSGVGKTSFARLLAGQANGEGSGISLSCIHTVLYSYNRERLPSWSSTGSHLDKVCPRGKGELKRELVEIFQVAEVLDSRFSQLSMGQQNRMNLIRYLLQEFDLLILDESLANVDEALREKILLAVKALFPDKFFLYISHNLMEVARFCRDILVLSPSAGGNAGALVRGQDYFPGYEEDHGKLDATILEIMNAV